jgi:catechol 2,3-dioxygenase-like lactoylglutathione lyase family enzyme
MLTNNPVFPSIRVSSLEKAEKFYGEKLGLKAIYKNEGELLFLAGKNSRIYLYEGKKSTATHTLAVFYVEDIYKTIESLSGKGVKFEHYNTGEIKTDERGVASRGGKKAAWFTDPDGNVLGLSQIS